MKKMTNKKFNQFKLHSIIMLEIEKVVSHFVHSKL